MDRTKTPRVVIGLVLTPTADTGAEHVHAVLRSQRQLRERGRLNCGVGGLPRGVSSVGPSVPVVGGPLAR